MTFLLTEKPRRVEIEGDIECQYGCPEDCQRRAVFEKEWIDRLKKDTPGHKGAGSKEDKA